MTDTLTHTLTLNRHPFVKVRSIEQPSMDEVKATPSLWNATLEDAMKYGGDLTREALSAMDIRGDRKYVVVDTKVHMLAPGQFPALPGWHTDGTPRLPQGWAAPELATVSDDVLIARHLHPQNKGLPVIEAQERMESPLFHLLVTGEGCLTRFIDGPVDVEIPPLPDRSLYREITRQVRTRVEAGELDAVPVPSCMAVEWDWWALHAAYPAEKVEWRFLIRVTEGDYNEPQTDLRTVMRTQNTVYAPIDAGW